MITLKISEDCCIRAEKEVTELPIFDYSHRERQANEVGCLGELIFEQWMNQESILITDDRQETTHDYRLANGQTIDVKTKDRTVPPQPHYDCSVPLYNHTHQRPAYYLFVSLERAKDSADLSMRRFHTAYILGGLNQQQLEAYGTVWKKDQIDPANGTKFWTDCINVSIDRLTPCDKVLSRWRELSN